MNKKNDCALLIFVKNARSGAVKTRLAATVGDERALEVYEMLLQYTRSVAGQVQADRQVWFSQEIPDDNAWNSAHYSAYKQQGADLGARMKQAFKQAFNDGYQRVVIIGSDCGQLQAGHINQAYEALNAHDVVIGPSKDGGYYLLGMNAFYPDLFDGKNWSTPEICESTVADCRRLGHQYSLLPQLNDVDTEADWNEVKDKFCS